MGQINSRFPIKHDPKYPIDLEFYNCYFASIKKQIVSDLADGTSKLTISPDMFKDYYIDYIPYKEQQEFVKTKLKDFLKLQEKYKKAQEQLSQDIANLYQIKAFIVCYRVVSKGRFKRQISDK